MRKIYSLLFFICSVSVSNGQGFDVFPTYIYQISAAEAKDFYENNYDNEIETQQGLFHTLVDSFSTRIYSKEYALNGYYLFVNTSKEKLEVELQTFHSHIIKHIDKEDELLLQVLDSNQVILSDIVVLYQNKQLKYQPKVNAFPQNGQPKSGVITILVEKDTLYFDLERKKSYGNSSWWKRNIQYGKVGRWWRNVRRNWVSRYEYGEWLNRLKYTKNKGYFVINQPKYKLEDTVKIKAYLTHKNGKPLQQKTYLALYEDDLSNEDWIYEYDPILTVPLTADKYGNYTYDLVLGDSLTIDQTYYLYLFKSVKGKKRKTYFVQEFELEDYELDKVKYDFSSITSVFRNDDKIILKASAQDQNGQYIPDGTLRLTLETYDVKEFYSKKVLIPDTLWTQTVSLKSNGETQILIPFAVFPNAKIEVNAKAEFYNSNGEYNRETIRFTVDRETDYIDFEMVGNDLVAQWMKNGVSIDTTAILYSYAPNNKKSSYNSDVVPYNIKTTKIQLPFKQQFSPFYQQYDIENGTVSAVLNVDQINSNVYVSGRNSGDSVSLSLVNPKRLLVQLWIYQNQRLVFQDTTSEQIWNFEDKSNKSAYSVAYKYLWAGDYKSKNTYFLYKKNKLSIKISQPEKVLPGQSLPVKIQVEDQNKRPVKSVNLVAMATNAAFKNDNIYQFRYNYNYKVPKNYKRKYRYALNDLNGAKKNLAINQKWFDELELEKSLYYRIRFPEKGLSFEYVELKDSFYQNEAQFAPYVVRNGKREHIYLIYCNQQLRYYAYANRTHPYSFRGKNGYNTITVRTRHGEYTIDSVLLKNGYKLELSLDEGRYIEHPHSQYITYRSLPTQLTRAEKNVLKKTMLFYRPKEHSLIYFWQSKHDIHIINTRRNRIHTIGPFVEGFPIRMIVQDGMQRSLDFESGFTYEIDRHRERLYENKTFVSEEAIWLNGNRELPKVGELVYHSDVIQPFSSNTFDKDWYDNKEKSQHKEVGRYRIEGGFLKDVVLLLWKKDKKIIDFSKGLSKTLIQSKGSYELIFYLSDSTYFEHLVTLRSDTLLYEYFENEHIEFQKDENLNILKAYTESYRTVDTITIENETIELDLELQQSILNYEGGETISGVITDQKTGEGLIGANILVKGTTIGTATDINGRYTLTLPKRAYKIIVSYVGYDTREVKVNELGVVDIGLVGSKLGMSELIVIGYSSQKKSNLTGAVTSVNYNQSGFYGNEGKTIVNALRDQAGVVSVIGSTNNNTRPLMVVDGVITTVQPNLDLIKSTDILKDEAATAIYGSRAANGVIIITTKSARSNQSQIISAENTQNIQPAIRSQFQDYAYFEPRLITDRNGEAFFTAHFPDNITKWNTVVVGMDRKQRAGVTKTSTKSYKPAIGQLAIPRFLVEGDQVNIIGKSINYTNDSFKIETQFKQGDSILMIKNHLLKDAIIEKTQVKAGEPTDSFKLTYQFTTHEFGDGEQRSIPIVEQGTKETIGQFWLLDKDTTFTFEKQENFGDLQVSVQTNALDVLLKDIEYLKKYPHGCNEQNTSRLLAYLLEENIKDHLDEPFKHKKTIIKTIRKIQSTQNPDGGWGWWKDGQSSGWITAYALKTLKKAELQGYKTILRARGDEILRFLVNNYYSFDQGSQMYVLQTLIGLQDNLVDNEMLNDFIQKIEKINLRERMTIALVQQHQNDTTEIDTILQSMKKTTFGGFYWGEDGYRWFDNTIPLTLMAYHIFRKAGKEEICEGIRRYFLEKRTHNGWRNTFESAQILNIILPELLNEDQELEDHSLFINGRKINLEKSKPVAYSDASITFTKRGNTPIFVTAYQQFHNRKPKSKSDLFKISTIFIQKGKSVKDKIFTQNQPLTLKTTVDVIQSADYVMIEIPIPAGCSYLSKPSFRYGHEVHREYFKDKVAIFCEELPVGEYTFEIELETRFSGEFTVNPSKAEQMYFPIFYGRNEGKRIIVD